MTELRSTDTSPVNAAEQEQRAPLDRLYFLVHPLYLAKPGEQSDVFNSETERLYSNASKFVPDGNEALLLMPYGVKKNRLVRTFKKAINRSREITQKGTNTGNWVDLYRNIKAQAPDPKRVMLLEDIAWETNIGGETIVNRLLDAHLTISSDTDIVIGGELLNQCLAGGVNRVLSIPHVQRVRIDKQAVLSGPYSDYEPRPMNEADLNEFKSYYAQYGAIVYQGGYNFQVPCEVEDAGNYITIQKHPGS